MLWPRKQRGAQVRRGQKRPPTDSGELGEPEARLSRLIDRAREHDGFFRALVSSINMEYVSGARRKSARPTGERQLAHLALISMHPRAAL